MKKLLLVSLTFFGLVLGSQQVFAQTDEEAKIELIKNDPDWKLMAKIQDYVINSFVSAKIDIAKFNFNDENLFLKTINMSKEQYLGQAQLNKEAANRLLKKFDFSGGKCSTCNLSSDELVKTLKTSLQSLQSNPEKYTKFRTESLGVLKGQTNGSIIMTHSLGATKSETLSSPYRCCGWWYYACCVVCAASIEVFPVYLMCCTMCFHAECCNPE